MEILTNFLSEKLIKQIKTFIGEIKTFRTNHNSWPPELLNTSGTILIADIEMTSDLAESIKSEVKTKLPAYEQFWSEEWHFSIHLGTHLSYIPWHDDNGHLLTITVYLNEHWDVNWSGYFLFQVDKDHLVQAIFPQFNWGMAFQPPMMHSVVMSNMPASPRESLQIFIDAKR